MKKFLFSKTFIDNPLPWCKSGEGKGDIRKAILLYSEPNEADYFCSTFKLAHLTKRSPLTTLMQPCMDTILSRNLPSQKEEIRELCMQNLKFKNFRTPLSTLGMVKSLTTIAMERKGMDIGTLLLSDLILTVG